MASPTARADPSTRTRDGLSESNNLQPYFAYGSNMSTAQMAQRCPGARAIGIGTITGWRFLINARGVATIAPCDGSVVWGVLWECSPAHLETLDGFEGVAAGRYRRDYFAIETGSAPLERVLAYVEPDYLEGPPRAGYLERVLTGAREFALPDDYIAALAAWAERKAPSPG